MDPRVERYDAAIEFAQETLPMAFVPLRCRLAAGLFAGAMSLAFTGCDRSPASPPEPPAPAPPTSAVLLITLDTTRADALSCYDDQAPPTPALDRIATEGVRFTEVRTVAPITLPAHSSLMTGRLPIEHGVRDNGTFALPDTADTLAEQLLDAGYETGAVLASSVLDIPYGLSQGFLHYDEAETDPSSPRGYRAADAVVDACERWLDEGHEPGAPFFLWAHFFDPHRPLLPPPEHLQAEFGSPLAARSLPEIERERGLYRAEIRFVDQQVGRLLELVRARAAMESRSLTLCVVADHGEGNGDHGELTHGQHLYETTIRVPWLLQGPGLPAGVTVDVPTSIVDVAPTLLASLGLVAVSAHGLDLAPWIEDAKRSPPERRFLLESLYPYTNHGWAPQYGVVDGTWKLSDSTRPELFDLATDPQETQSVAEMEIDRVASMRQTFEGLSVSALSRRTPSPAEAEALRRLGYLVDRDIVEERPDAFAPGFRDPSLREPKDAQGLVNRHGLAFTYAARGDVARAAALMKQCADEDPGNPNYNDLAAAFHNQLGRHREALPYAEAAAQLDAHTATVWVNLAKAREGVGDHAKAIAALQTVLQLDPRAVQARLDLARLLSSHEQKHGEAISLLRQALDLMSDDDPMREPVETKVRELTQGGE